MPNSRIPSPARSQGVISTPRKQLRRTLSVGSPSRTNVPLSSIIESYKVSPVPTRQSVLNDDTDIDMPRRRSWWKKIDDNSRDVLELLERKELVEVNNVEEEFDMEVLSQENKNYALDLPESSDGESINSIVIPQRKLFTKKDNQPQIKFGQITNNREALQKFNKSYVDQDKELNIGRKTLFSQPSKPRTKPVFPAALLNISANKTANKSKELPTAEVNGQGRSLFGGRPGTKRKNMFADFIVSESEDEILEIQPKVQKKNDPKPRASSMSRHSPTSSLDLEMDDWRHLPSSTMVDNQIDEATSPVKRIKLNDKLETKDSEISTKSNNTLNKTKQANKSVSSKNKSMNVSNIHHQDDKSNEIHKTPPTSATTNNSRVTRSMGRSLRENSINASNVSKNVNKTKNKTQNNQDRSIKLRIGKSINNVSKIDSDKVQEKQNMLLDHLDPDENFTLQYDNDDNEVVIEMGSLKNDNKSPIDKTASNINVDVVQEKNNLVKESSVEISEDNFVEQETSNKICENQEEILENNQNYLKNNKVSNYHKIQNNSQEIRNVVELNKNNTNVQKLNNSIEKEKVKNTSKSIRNSIEKYNDIQKEKSYQELSINKDVEKNMKLGKSSQNLNEENCEVHAMENENEHNESGNNNGQHSDIEEEVNESTQLEENNDSEIEEEINECEHQKSLTENVSEKEADNVDQQVINENNTDEADKEMILDNRCDNIEDIKQVSLPNVSHDATGRHRKQIKSPEVILHDKTKQIDSFTVQARNTSVRKTKSITFHNNLETVTDFRKSTGFSDATGNSSAEGSGWDSHRTTRKTLRQTFGKDFTPRKSLRALVMEKTAKLQANYTEVVDNIKIPIANSTEYDHDQDELDSYPETELVQVEQSNEMIQVDKRNKTIQIEEDQQVGLRNITGRLDERDKTQRIEERDETNQLERRNEVDQSKSPERNEMELCEDRDETDQFEEKDDTEQSEEREEMNKSKNEEKDETKSFEEREKTMEQSKSFEEREDVEESEEREENKKSVEREEMEQSDEREEMEQSVEIEEMEQSAEREEIEQSEEREELEQSEEREELEHPEEREELEQSEEREELEHPEEREELEQSEEREEFEHPEEREELEQSEEREELEQSEEREELEQSEEREELEQSEEREELEQSEEREELEQSEEREELEQSEESEEIEQSENDERDETEQFEERDEIDQSEDEIGQFEEKDETIPDDEVMAEVSDHEISKRTTQTSLETYLHKIKQDNAEKRRQMQEDLRNSLKNPKRDAFSLFKVPQRPVRRTIKIQKPKTKQIKSVIPFEMLPSEVIEDMKYKPPKRFQPNNASWITKRLYKFLESKLEPKYDYKARLRAEKLVQCIYNFTKEVRRHDSVRSDGIEELKREMARLDIVKTHFDFYEFCHEFLPREIRIKIVPDIVNNIPLPRHGVFSDILR